MFKNSNMIKYEITKVLYNNGEEFYQVSSYKKGWLWGWNYDRFLTYKDKVQTYPVYNFPNRKEVLKAIDENFNNQIKEQTVEIIYK